MMKTVNTLMGLTLFVVLGGITLGACKKPVEEVAKPECCDAGCDVDQKQPASSTTPDQPTDSDTGKVESPAPSAPEAK